MSKIKILIVEDEAIVALSIQRRLEEIGYDVVATAKSNRETLAVLENLATRDRPNLVLMDIKLQGDFDGIQTATQIRNMFDIPIIYLTGYSDISTVERAKITEPYGYMIKPFDITGLRSTIEIALHKYEMDLILRRRERLLAATLKSIGDGVITTDSQARVTFLNPVAESLTGYQNEESIGRKFSQIFRARDHSTGKAIENPAKRAIQAGEVVKIGRNAMLVNKHGQETRIQDSAAPIKDELGDIAGAVMVFSDAAEEGL